MKIISLLFVFLFSSILAFTADEDVIWSKLKNIVIPEVDFRNMRLEDVYNTIADSSRKNDATHASGVKGINLVISLTPEEKEKKVNLSAKNILLFQLLNIVTKSTGTRYTVTGSVVMVGGQEVSGETERIARSYGIPLTISGDIRKKGAKKFLEELGVKFPEGSSATYVGATGKMLVVNSPDNLKLMEKILRGMGVTPSKQAR
ncbi:MAG: hypothetical protein PHR77_13800 [Kiritimatiellae bacterium]|nr:hypothetical protein [Kiritimatiellia bacterium]MDD5521443.1 hypothetical protein [Kiritimatiellia bacterium]